MESPSRTQAKIGDVLGHTPNNRAWISYQCLVNEGIGYFCRILDHHTLLVAEVSSPSAEPHIVLLREEALHVWNTSVSYFLRQPALLKAPDHFDKCFYEVYRRLTLYISEGHDMRPVWLEPLGDLCFYRALYESHPGVKEEWLNNSHTWYEKASLCYPTVGRLYSQLARTSSNPLRRLHFIMLSLTCSSPEGSWNQIFDVKSDIQLIRIHQLIREETDQFVTLARSYIVTLEHRIRLLNDAWKEEGMYIAVVNIASVLCAPRRWRYRTQRFAYDVLDSVLSHHMSGGAQNVQPYIHVNFAFLHYLAANNIRMLLARTPWRSVTQYLNAVKGDLDLQHIDVSFGSPLPEDYAIGAMDWGSLYRRKPWNMITDDTRDPLPHEPLDFGDQRRLRILSLGQSIAECSSWISYNEHGFAVRKR